MRALYIWVLTFFIGIINFVPPFDTDLGWHYRCGAELLRGAPCLNNTFSYYLSDYQAYYASFISDAITALIYDSAGLTGLSILHSGVIATIAYLFISRSYQHPVVSTVVFLIINLLSWPIISIGWRPQMITILLIFWLYLFIKKILTGEEKKYTIILLISLLMLFWVNTHMGFFTGILLLVVALADVFFKYIYSYSTGSKRIFFIIGLGLFFSFLSSLINPFGWRVYEEIFRHGFSPLNEMIAEWTPPLLHHRFLIGIMTSLFVITQLRSKQRALFSLVIILFFAVSSYMARRNLPIYYILTGFELLALTPSLRLSWLQKNTVLYAPLAAAGMIATLFFTLHRTLSINMNWEQYCTRGMAHFPCRAIASLPNLKGNIFVPYEYGGFFIWQKPDSKVFIDGRMPAWQNEQGISPYKIYLSIVQTQPGWNELLKKYHTDFILTQKGTFLELALRKSGTDLGWRKIYEDGQRVVYSER